MSDQHLHDRLSAMAGRVVVDDRVSEITGESYARAQPFAERRRRTLPFAVAAVSLGAACGIGLVALRSSDGDHEAQGNAPAVVETSVVGEPVEAAQRNFPIIDEADIPVPVSGLWGSYSTSDEHQGWSGVLVAGPLDHPTDVVGVAAFPTGGFQPTSIGPSPGATPRRPDVQEFPLDPGFTLMFKHGTTVFSLVGQDRETLYSLVDVVEPATNSGYRFTTELPRGLREVGGHVENRPGRWPNVSDESQSISIEVLDGVPLSFFAEYPAVEQLAIAGRAAWIGTKPGRAPTVAIDIGSNKSLLVFGHDLTRDQVVEMASKIRLADEPTWRERYQVVDRSAPVETAVAPAISSPVVSVPPTGAATGPAAGSTKAVSSGVG